MMKIATKARRAVVTNPGMAASQFCRTPQNNYDGEIPREKKSDKSNNFQQDDRSSSVTDDD